MRSSPEWYDEHGDAAAGAVRLDRLVEGGGQGVELAVDLDADRLERALGRVAAGAPGRRRDGRDDHLGQLGRRLDRAGGDDRRGDAPGEALVAVAEQDAGQLLGG